MKCGYPLTASLLLAFGVMAAPWSPATARAVEQVTFLGSATISSRKQPVDFTFTCSPSGPGLIGSFGVTIRISVGASAHFNFDPFEGPDGTRRRLSRLIVQHQGATRGETFAASGGYGPGEAFTLTVSAARNDPVGMRFLATLLKPVAQPATLFWQQRGAGAREAGFVAQLRLAPGGAARLYPTIAPCLAT